MKKALTVIIFLSACVAGIAQSRRDQDVLAQLFSLKEVKEEILKYYGRHLYYSLMAHDSSLVLPRYDKIDTAKKVGTGYVSGECEAPDLVIFIYQNAETIYLQLFSSDGRPHPYADYPLLNHGASTYFRIELSETGTISSAGKYGYIAN